MNIDSNLISHSKNDLLSPYNGKNNNLELNIKDNDTEAYFNADKSGGGPSITIDSSDLTL